MNKIIHKELGFQLMGMAYTVHNLLGPGLLEHAYQEALCVELELAGIPFEREKVYALEYKGRNVGTYFADLVVDGKILLELKSVLEFHPPPAAKPVNYPTVSGLEVGYLINFQHRHVEWTWFVRRRE